MTTIENSIYLEKVLTFLKQELPKNYRDELVLEKDKFVLTLPEGADFQQCYQSLYPIIQTQVGRIMNRLIDLHFTIKSKFQERDFTLVKVISFDA